MKNKLIMLMLLSAVLAGCGSDTIPKPKGYFRIDLPKKEYVQFKDECPFTFRHPVYSVVREYEGGQEQKCWYNVEFPKFKGTIHLSYYSLNNDLSKHIEDSRALAFKHSVKANAIDERSFRSSDGQVNGLVYDIAGNAASSVQFYITDSTSHFVRGALYFNASPNYDSIAPVQEFIRKDIDTLISSFRWK